VTRKFALCDLHPDPRIRRTYPARQALLLGAGNEEVPPLYRLERIRWREESRGVRKLRAPTLFGILALRGGNCGDMVLRRLALGASTRGDCPLDGMECDLREIRSALYEEDGDARGGLRWEIETTSFLASD
jgi:hypothetical protein